MGTNDGTTIMFEDVTLVLTSCNRLDLLDRTLASIGDEVLDSIKHKIIIDDSGDPICTLTNRCRLTA